MIWVFLCSTVLLGFAVPLSAARQQNAATLAPALDLQRLVDLAALRLQARIEYTPGQLAGQVTIRGEISDRELWSLLNARLADSAMTLVATDSPKRFRVVKLDPALATSVPIVPARWTARSPDDGGKPPNELEPSDAISVKWPDDLPPGYAAVLITLRVKTAKEAADLVRPLLTKPAGAVFTLGDDSNRVVVADLWSRVSQVLDILPDIDSAGIAPAVEEIPVVHVSVPQLIASVKELATKRDLVADPSHAGGRAGSGAELLPGPGGRSVLLITPLERAPFWKELVATLDAPPGIETREYRPVMYGVKEVSSLVREVAAGVSTDQFRMVVNELTGTLIVTTTPTLHERVGSLFSQLEETPVGQTVRLRSFPIRNRPVREVAGSLDQLLAAAREAGTLEVAGVTEAGPGGSSAAARDSGTMNPFRPQRTNPAEPGSGSSESSPAGTNTARGSQPAAAVLARHQGGGLSLTVDEGMNAIIAIGEPRMLAQVEALLKTLDVRQPQVMIECFLVSLSEAQSQSVSVELQKFTTLDGNIVQLSSLFGATATGSPPDIGAPPGTAFTGAVLNPGDFNAVIRAIERVNAGKSTSVPRVLVSNNQSATFRSVSQQPTSNTSTNTTSTTITSFGGFQDAGTTISVRPQIAEGEQLVLTYSVELSAFTGQPSDGLPSPRQENSVSSVSLIPDGHTVVVGGFELTTESEDETQVPVLGEIPLLGELFKSRTVSDSRIRFFVFIRGNVMRHDRFEDLKHVSTADLADTGLDDGFPSVEPLVIR